MPRPGGGERNPVVHAGQPHQLPYLRPGADHMQPPCWSARRAAPTSTPRPDESMNVIRFRSTISVCPSPASSNRHSRSRLTVEMSNIPQRPPQLRRRVRGRPRRSAHHPPPASCRTSPCVPGLAVQTSRITAWASAWAYGRTARRDAGHAALGHEACRFAGLPPSRTSGSASPSAAPCTVNTWSTPSRLIARATVPADISVSLNTDTWPERR